MRRLSPRFLGTTAIGGSALAALGAIGACTGAVTTTGFVPVTSVLVRAESVIPPSQCGSGTNQIARYTVVISSYVKDPRTDAAVPPSEMIVRGGGAYPCYADAMFANLPAPQVGLNFSIDVFLWSADDYAAAPDLSGMYGIESKLREPAQIAIDAGPGLLANLRSLKSTATRHCAATQISSVQTVAQCDPAVFSDAGPTMTDSGADTGANDASMDAKADALADAPSD